MGTISKNVSSSIVDIAGRTFVTEQFSINSRTSPVVNGRLQLRTNPGTIRKAKASGYNFPSMGQYPKGGALDDCQSIPNSVPGGLATIAESKCAERLRSEILTKGNLAVTLAQIHKSRQNALSAVQAICAVANKDLAKLEAQLPGFGTTQNFRRGRATSRATKSTSRVERLANTASSKFLEGIFGWAPLIAEYETQMQNLAKSQPYRSTIRASGVERSTSTSSSSTYRFSRTYEFECRVRYRVTMTVDNPQAYLASQSGLTNYAGAAWDVVPWSFVVNMFTNIGHIVNSLSSIQGVTFSDPCKTVRHSTRFEHRTWNGNNSAHGFSQGFGYSKTISKSLPVLKFRMRTPQLNAGLVGIAVSLVTQRLTRVKRFIDTM